MINATRKERLPRNQALVLDALRRTSKPLTAYELLDALRDHGMRAPLTVYRALDALRERGLAHRLESIKAFVACSEHDHQHEERPAFAVCGSCGTVLELEDPALLELLTRIAADKGFRIDRSMVELLGNCSPCRLQQGGGKAS